jgi:hypothetical protein
MRRSRIDGKRPDVRRRDGGDRDERDTQIEGTLKSTAGTGPEIRSPEVVPRQNPDRTDSRNPSASAKTDATFPAWPGLSHSLLLAVNSENLLRLPR